jgi:chromosome partitioning protein
MIREPRDAKGNQPVHAQGRNTMPVISFASPKGGVGKSTSALILASGLTHASASVAVIDGDPNGTLYNWSQQTEGTAFECFKLPNDNEIVDLIEDVSTKHQFVIVDLEGTANLAMSRAISRTDLVIIPLQASPVDARQASRAIKLVLDEGRALRRTIPYKMLFTRVSAAVKTKDEKEIRTQFNEMSIPTFDTELNDRAAFRAMFSHYKSLWDLTNEATNLEKARYNAAEFVKEVTDEIRRQMAEERAA